MSVRALYGEYRENSTKSLIPLSGSQKAALSWAAIEDHDTVLELDCRDTAALGLIEDSLNTQCFGLCRDEKEARYAAEILEKSAFAVSEGDRLPYRDRTFHVVFSAQKEIKDPSPEELREIFRVMRPGAQLVISGSLLRTRPQNCRALMRSMLECGYKNVSCRISGLNRVIIAWRRPELKEKA